MFIRSIFIGLLALLTYYLVEAHLMHVNIERLINANGDELIKTFEIIATIVLMVGFITQEIVHLVSRLGHLKTGRELFKERLYDAAYFGVLICGSLGIYFAATKLLL